ncbi:MAG: tail fiber domain-containing protein [Saprospiraceae bacterium]
MKNVLMLIRAWLFLCPFSFLFSQTDGFNYQAVLRHNDFSPWSNQTITVFADILDGGPSGPILYAEQHVNVLTDPNGLFNLVLGEGMTTSGSFNSINWSGPQKFLQVRVAIGGGSPVLLGTPKPFESVPLAKYANSASPVGAATGDLTGNYPSPAVSRIQGLPVDPSTPASGQVLKWNGASWSPQNDLQGGGGGGSQTLSLTGNLLSISGGNSVTIDGSTTNEIQALSISGQTISLSNGGGSVMLPPEVDGSVTNEIQALSLSGANLSLSNGGGTVTLPTGTTYTAGSGIGIAGNVISATDASATNEIQALSIAGQTLSLSNGGGSIMLPSEVDASITNEIQALSLSGANLSLSNGGGTVTLPTGTTYTAGSGIGIAGNVISATDASVTNEIQALSIAGQTLSLSNGGGSVSIPTGTNYWTLNGSTISNNNGGSVGIGMNMPASPLHVHANFDAQFRLTGTSGSSATDGLSMRQNGADFEMINHESGKLTFVNGLTDGFSRITIGENRNIGINVLNPNPDVNLHLSDGGCCPNTTLHMTNRLGGETQFDGAVFQLTDGGAFGIFNQEPDGPINFSTNGNLNMMTLKGDNVGIGITNPIVALQVHESSSAAIAHFTNNATGSDFIDGLILATNGPDFEIANQEFTGNLILSSGNGPSFLSVGNNRRLGINTNSPEATCHVHTNGADFSNVLLTHSVSGSTAADGLYIGHSGSTNGALFTNQENGPMSFRTGGAFEDHITIATNGNIGIGMTDPTEKLHIDNGRLVFSTPVTSGVVPQGISLTNNYNFELGGNWTSSADNLDNLGSPSKRWGTVYAFNGMINTSDAREKQSIAPINYGLAQVMAMKPVSFEWKSMPETGRKLGFLAQDLQGLLPEVVVDKTWSRPDETGRRVAQTADRLGVAYSDLIPVLTKAIQEQQDLINQQQDFMNQQADLIKKMQNQLSVLAADVQTLKTKR